MITLILLITVFTGLLYLQAVSSRSMSVASGHENGRLLPCPESPNCVSSQADIQDSPYIAGISVPDSSGWPRLIGIVSAMKRVQLISQDGNYAHFTFQTPVMGFVDDVEFYYTPESSVIHVRSASRVGYSDGNTNRNRVESIRSAVTAQ